MTQECRKVFKPLFEVVGKFDSFLNSVNRFFLNEGSR